MIDFEKYNRLLNEIAIETKLVESSKVTSESQDFIYANRDKLIQQYPEQWVAVHRKTVVGHHEDLLHLVRELRAKRMPLPHIALEMLSHEEIPLALQFAT